MARLALPRRDVAPFRGRASRGVRPGESALWGGPAAMLRLQRLAGNTAVAALVSRLRCPPKAAVQTSIEVADAAHAEDPDPKTRWSFTTEEVALYKDMIADTNAYAFETEVELAGYVRHYAKWFAKDASGYRAQAKGQNLARIVDAKPAAPEHTKSELRVPIEVELKGGGKERVEPFTSKRRHLLETFTESKEKPPEAKAVNVVVLDPVEFEMQFQDYSGKHAEALKRRRMLQGYEPGRVPHASSTVAFGTDQPEVPNMTYDRQNAIHSFPEKGSGVRNVSQDTYARLVIVSAYMYATDEYLRARRAEPKRGKEREAQLAGWQRSAAGKVSYEKALKAAKELRDNLQVIEAAGFTPSADIISLAKTWDVKEGKEKGPLIQKLNSAVEALYDLLLAYGGLPEVGPGADLSVGEPEATAVYQELIKDPVGLELVSAVTKLKAPTNKPPATPVVASGGGQRTRKEKYEEAIKAARTPYAVRTRSGVGEKLERLKSLIEASQKAGIDYRKVI